MTAPGSQGEECRRFTTPIPNMSAVLYIVSRMQTNSPVVQGGHRCEPRSVGPTLRALRLEAGLTQTMLAQKLGTTQSAVARMEAGRCRTSLESVQRVAAALGCDLGLVFDQQPPA